MSKGACRLGDLDFMHCSQPYRGQGSNTVFVNGKAWSCLSHQNIVHLKPSGDKCIPHQSPISSASSTVFVDGLGAGRITDDVGGADCTTVMEGSYDVFVG